MLNGNILRKLCLAPYHCSGVFWGGSLFLVYDVSKAWGIGAAGRPKL